ncbi:16S rRNA methyltransferase [Anopheles sinensis]|uniref:16S rRNA methyltransferase n=1 Tax=Anopheles sinensis TaxID=74873 RepID=A0A084W1H3_ANOSI|nr:16S rRNA methyltransferase [Anopheles sinensis]
MVLHFPPYERRNVSPFQQRGIVMFGMPKTDAQEFTLIDGGGGDASMPWKV